MGKETNPGMDEKEMQEGKVFAIISYMIILCIVTLALKKENKFALFHGKQGLVILICWVGGAILSMIPILGGLIWLLTWVVLGIVSLMGIVQALMGRYWKIPVIGEIADKIKI